MFSAGFSATDDESVCNVWYRLLHMMAIIDAACGGGVSR